MRYLIVQPATAERVRSSACYVAYWVAAGLGESGEAVDMLEDCTVGDLEAAPLERYDRVLIDYSSYPQREQARAMADVLHREQVEWDMIGYRPMVDAEGWPWAGLSNELILKGAFAFVRYHRRFKYALSSDCDYHIRSIDRGRRVVPVFLSVGCDVGCGYCYVSHGNYPRGHLPMSEARELIRYCARRKWDIHFCDENLLKHPDFPQIAEELSRHDVRYIFLANSTTLTETIDTIGLSALNRSGARLAEIGLETIDPLVLAKRQDVERIKTIRCGPKGLNIFWLTMTFLPHDTPAGIRATGRFLEAYGYRRGEMFPRIETNSTAGGLGQFFLPYHGTPYYDHYEHKGWTLGSNWTRLWPSFVGNRFLEAPIRAKPKTPWLPGGWYDMYMEPERVYEVMVEVERQGEGCTPSQVLQERREWPIQRTLVALAQLCRTGEIEAC
jgi:hypothetical protein